MFVEWAHNAPLVAKRAAVVGGCGGSCAASKGYSMKFIGLKRAIGAALMLLGSQTLADLRDVGTIDAIAAKPDSPYVVLLMFQSGDWGAETEALLDQKIQAYKEFVTSGQLVAGRPQAKGRKVRMILVYQQKPGSDVFPKLEAAQATLLTEGLQFVWGDRADVIRLADAP